MRRSTSPTAPGIPCDRLRSHILEWRSRCSRRQRDFEAAREDIERALELAERLDDTLTVAHITFQASLVAERDGQWLRARTLAERAKELYEAHGDRQNLGRMLNNLGGLNFLLGKSDDADLVPEARVLRRARDRQRCRRGAGRVIARTGPSRRAATGDSPRSRLATRSSCSKDVRTFWTRSATRRSFSAARCSNRSRLDEAEQAFAEAELNLSQLSSASHRAVAWTAQGDLASTTRRRQRRRLRSTGVPQRPYKTLGSKREEVTKMLRKIFSLGALVVVAVTFGVGNACG